MGRIKKAPSERHSATMSPAISDFVQQAVSTPLPQLPAKLASFPQHWPLPRGDLYHWIPLLDRFDHILELFNKEYKLDEGPQTQPFERRLLQKCDAEEGLPYGSAGEGQELDTLGYSPEGDRELVESVVHFTRVLLEHCGNRSLYASTGHINDLLHTTSLSLLRLCLKLGLRLAQRYQTARYKNSHPNAQASLQANHYNFKLENLEKLAHPFPRPTVLTGTAAVTPGKNKEKATQGAFNPSDLGAIAQDPQSIPSKIELASVTLSYYDHLAVGGDSQPTTIPQPTEASPATPTPVRRTSNLGPSRDRPWTGERSASSNDVSDTPIKSREHETSSATSNALKSYHISATKVVGTPAWALVREALPNVPKAAHYDVLRRIRIAKAFAEDHLQLLLQTRLLAVANLTYALSESKFQESVGNLDSEEPKRFHLAQQLCDLLQPVSNSRQPLSSQTETVVLQTLEALLRTKHKQPEVVDALAISVNHGLLYYELRKAVATLSLEDHAQSDAELLEAEWRNATFDLVNTLSSVSPQNRYSDKMVAAGIIGILVEVLTLRTSRAGRFHERIVALLNSYIHGIPTAFQTLANVKGLDILADLTSYEVEGSLQSAKSGRGMPQQFKSKVVDYDIPYFQQATLRQLFKSIVHMFDHNSGAHDRLLRNLMDSPPMLGALRTVLENAAIFGSNVWSGAINIMSSFIHNEPTSYMVVAEAGLPKALIDAVTKSAGQEDSFDALKRADGASEGPYSGDSGELIITTVPGILPVGETMSDIPNAFGAICLNENGMKLFQTSHALPKFFAIFLSPPHVKAMEEGGATAAAIGNGFDELSRHHPQLKQKILQDVLAMIMGVRTLTQKLATQQSVGAKLWAVSQEAGELMISGGKRAASGHLVDEDTEITARDVHEEASERALATPYTSACFKFLEGFFNNASMCQMFCEKGGADIILDMALSPSNPYDLVAFPVFSKMTGVVKTLCEQRAHLVLPNLLHRTRQAVSNLKPLIDSDGSNTYFGEFTRLPSEKASADGTTVLKALGAAHVMTHILSRVLAPPHYSGHRSTQSNQLFTALNFTDIYMQLVNDLSKLHAACLWENLALQKTIPDKWKSKTDPRPFIMRRVDANGMVEITAESRSSSEIQDGASASSEPAEGRMELFTLKNTRAIRYLLSQAPMGVESFFHSLGQALVPKRTQDENTKMYASAVAENLANSVIWELDYRRFSPVEKATELQYVVQVLAVTNRMMLRNSTSMDSFGSKEAVSLVLSKFYLAGGFTKLNSYLAKFSAVLANLKGEPVELDALEGQRHILSFYDQVVRSKCINEALQSSLISSRGPERADYFMPSQFLVEIRDVVLGSVGQLWATDAITHMAEQSMKAVIDILRLILKAEGEDRALKREDKATRRVPTSKPEYKLRSRDNLGKVQSAGYSEDLAAEALYRCNNNDAHAVAYCALRVGEGAPRFPIPEPSTDRASPDEASQQQVAEPSVHRQPSIEMGHVEDQEDSMHGLSSDQEMADDVNFGSLGALPADLADQDLLAMVGGAYRPANRILMNGGPPSIPAAPPAKDTEQPFVTVDDLNEKREKVRANLIDRCLEVLSSDQNITFELADLIQAAVARSGEGTNPRAEIGKTLVSSLLSLQGEEPSLETAQKISAYAHLVALILQDREFFDSTLDELKDYFDTLVNWVRLQPEQKVEDAPWIEMLLLIIERVLAEDEQPAEIQWDPPPVDDPLKVLPSAKVPELVVSEQLRMDLFDALVELLPKVGKNSSLALSLSRVLVVLTRKRDVAMRLSEKHRLSRLFLMIRQMAGSTNEKLRGALLLILRHMVEDKDTLRQIMQAEIKGAFQNRSMRNMDTTSYARNLYHLVLRDTELFLNVTKEMIEIARFDGHPHRAQVLKLKESPQGPADQEQPPVAGARNASEGGSADAQKPAEGKSSIVETTDGIIHFLLRELSNYKDVEDKGAPTQAETRVTSSATGQAGGDVRMSDNAPPNGAQSPAQEKSDKPVFKPDEHSIYVYRCFLLQCLAELLASYNRTKLEFISFSRKSETQVSTPSKPRSGTLNYLLNVLLPVGTLEHTDDIAHRKKLSTSGWATTVLVALCAKSQEKHVDAQMSGTQTSNLDPDTDLTFVRKFVLEHALRSFREATVAQETPGHKYSRLLALSDLFDKMLNGKPDRKSPVNADGHRESQQRLGRLMYERNLVAALTSAVAEIDLNFKDAKRAVKHILVPLKTLTDIVVELSQHSGLSTSDSSTSAEEDEITSTTSLSEGEGGRREQTPDLFRNSTLGLLESSAGHDDEDEESVEDIDEDDEMYDDGYEEEMDYDEEAIPEHGDVVSDEDEEIEGMEGLGDVEGMPGDVDMNLQIVMDDDEDASEDDDDEDESDEDEDDEDDDEDGGDFDEITGDDGNASLADPEEVEWEEDDGDITPSEDQIEDGGSPHGGPLEHIAHVIGADERSDTGEQDGVIQVDMHGDDEYFDDEMPGEEDDEDAGAEGDYDGDVVYEPELEEDDDDEDHEMGWDFNGPPPAVMGMPYHHHHHQRGGIGEVLGLVDTLRPPPFRSHRTASNSRVEDEGTNPLLQRDGGVAQHDASGDIPGFPRSGIARRTGLPRQGELMLQELVSQIGNGGHGGIERISVNIDAGASGSVSLPPVFTMGGRGGGHFLNIDPRRPWREQMGYPDLQSRTGNMRTDLGDVAQAFTFQPTLTVNRWQEEASILFGGKHLDKATRIINSLLKLLVPPAMEAKRIHDKGEAERRAAEEQAREEERKKAEAQKVEREAAEKREREEREAKEAEEAAARAREQAEQEAEAGQKPTGADAGEASAMEGVEGQADAAIQSQTEEPQTEQTPAQRVTISIRGRELDITDLGIDCEFLAAIPEEMQEDVIMNAITDRRAQAQQTGEPTNEISREFLEALPPEIQRELLQQEARDRRIREREEARRQAAQEGNAPAVQPQDPDAADMIAMLEPHLRQQVLMDMQVDEGVLATLPEEFQREARAMMGARHPHLLGRVADGHEARIINVGGPGGRSPRPHIEVLRARPVIQILDRAGVATLLRLMFVSLHHRAKTSLHGILSDACKNTTNRAEVISILLSILQDGTTDLGAVEKSFAQLSLRAKQANQKTPQPLKRTITGNLSGQVPMIDLSPLSIVQHCLGTLNALSHDNAKVPSFFLSEHEMSTKTAKKGKGKESKGAKYPINALLTLLDRKLITENTGVMETLASLLSRVTQPLTLLLKRSREAQEAKGDKKEIPEAPNAAAGQEAQPQAATADEPMGEAVTVTAGDSAPTGDQTAPVTTPTDVPGGDEDQPQEKKKALVKQLEPPDVPEENLRLVVNILAARDCPTKTFSDTLDIIKNLSAIPGAKGVFGRELVRQAQDFAHSIVSDLEDLAKQINDAQDGTDLQGMALASFSPAGAKQRKLLRVLVALDYIFDPKRMQIASTTPDATLETKLKEDVLATFYESSTFERLWSNLSLCLAAIRCRGNMVNVATILLPLIESLMVVCRNSTLKDTLTNAAEVNVSTPPPQTHMEGLFFTFTEEHRKILNELIRNNSKLMNGNLSVLAKNSKVLEFDNKRNYFNRQIHSRGTEARVPHISLTLNVRRDQVFLDSYKALYYKKPDEFKYGKLNIRFSGEEGIDAGGVSREWFGVMARQMFNADFALFNPVASDRTTFHPNTLSGVNPEHLLFFKFIGRIIGKALYEGRVLDCHFSRAVYRKMLGKPVSLKDMETLDLDYYKSLRWILDNDITDITFETFSVEVDRFGVTETVDLIPNGRDIPVTEENKVEYVHLVVEHRLIKSVEQQLDQFLLGFREIIPEALISIFNEQELELLISGLPDIDVDDWRNNTEYHNYQGTSPQIQWFWRAVKSFDQEERAKLLQFVTGTSKVPLNGFKELEGMNGFAKFNIHRDYSSKEKLPTSHTCFNQLDLPEYESYEHLRQQLYTAITAGSEYFGFA